jgi:hypothetical protein
MPDLRLPLSGNVTQTINPWTWFFNPVGNQVSLVTVNLGSSGDPDKEQQIIEDVGSYGRQIGRIGDALRVLIAHVPLENLNAQESSAIDALRKQLDAVDGAKAQRVTAGPG